MDVRMAANFESVHPGSGRSTEGRWFKWRLISLGEGLRKGKQWISQCKTFAAHDRVVLAPVIVQLNYEPTDEPLKDVCDLWIVTALHNRTVTT
jgi:hypothetical protein